MQYALPSDEERYAMLTGTGMYGGSASQSMPTGNNSGGYYSQPQEKQPKSKYGRWQDAMTIAEMKTIGDEILDEEGNPTGKKVYGDWRTAALPRQESWSPKGTDEPRYAGSGGGISGIPGGGLSSDEDRYALLTGSGIGSGTNSVTPNISSDEDRYSLLTGSGSTSGYDSSNYSSNYGLSSDEDRYALLTGSGSTSRDDGAWSGGSRDFDESTGTYRPGYRETSQYDSSNYGLSSDEDRYSLLTGSGGSGGYTPSNYSLSGLSGGLSSDEDRYAMLTGRKSPQPKKSIYGGWR